MWDSAGRREKEKDGERERECGKSERERKRKKERRKDEVASKSRRAREPNADSHWVLDSKANIYTEGKRKKIIVVIKKQFHRLKSHRRSDDRWLLEIN